MDLNVALFMIIYDAFHSQAADVLFSAVTWGGNLLAWAAAGIVLVLKRKERPATDLLVAGLILVVLVNALKYSVNEPRPFTVIPGVTILTLGPMSNETDPGFPSFHAAMATAGALIFCYAYPRRRVPLASLALLVSVSRVYLGVHYPVDVIAGSLIGLAVGWMVMKWEADNRLVKRFVKGMLNALDTPR